MLKIWEKHQFSERFSCFCWIEQEIYPFFPSWDQLLVFSITWPVCAHVERENWNFNYALMHSERLANINKSIASRKNSIFTGRGSTQQHNFLFYWIISKLTTTESLPTLAYPRHFKFSMNELKNRLLLSRIVLCVTKQSRGEGEESLCNLRDEKCFEGSARVKKR